MEIALKEVTVGELTEGYRDDGDAGVVGYGGRLDIRPPFQREFVYDERQRVAVIDTVMAGYPLNVMYWADRGDGSFEVIDGQQLGGDLFPEAPQGDEGGGLGGALSGAP